MRTRLCGVRSLKQSVGEQGGIGFPKEYPNCMGQESEKKYVQGEKVFSNISEGGWVMGREFAFGQTMAWRGNT